MTISVVIATYGSDEWLTMAETRALPSLRGFTAEDTFVMHHQSLSDHALGLMDNPGKARAWSLNTAAAQAPGDWLIFLDADDELAPGYVAAMRRALEQNTDGNQVLFTPAVQHIRKGRPGQPAFMDRGISLRDDNWMVIGTMIHKAQSKHKQGWRNRRWQVETHQRVAAELDAWEAAL
jgi:glycosyltransferase involved in cell wall biosynthesis